MMLGSFFASDMLWAVILLTDTFVWQPLRGPLVVRQFQLEDRGAIVRSSGLRPRYYCAHCILSSRSRIAATRSGRSLRAWKKWGKEIQRHKEAPSMGDDPPRPRKLRDSWQVLPHFQVKWKWCLAAGVFTGSTTASLSDPSVRGMGARHLESTWLKSLRSNMTAQ